MGLIDRPEEAESTTCTLDRQAIRAHAKKMEEAMPVLMKKGSPFCEETLKEMVSLMFKVSDPPKEDGNKDLQEH